MKGYHWIKSFCWQILCKGTNRHRKLGGVGNDHAIASARNMEGSAGSWIGNNYYICWEGVGSWSNNAIAERGRGGSRRKLWEGDNDRDGES